MSWMEQLVATYDENERFAGRTGVKNRKSVLAPIGHILQKAHISITLDSAGNLISADVIPKEEAETLIPCTEDSASRSSGLAPHPLHDNLQYIARDYGTYVEKKNKAGKDTPYDKYRELLGKWVSFDQANLKIKAVYDYISGHDVIGELIQQKILFQDQKGEILKKWPDKKGKPPLFDVAGSDVLKAFVRFRVEMNDGSPVNLWEDIELQKSYIRFLKSELISSEPQWCFATGRKSQTTEKHFKYVRFPGDGAKLISSNDKSGFTFRGRFETGLECASISMEASHKTMNVLRWLIRNQGYANAEKVFLAWGRKEFVPPQPFADTDRIIRRGRRGGTAQIPQTMKAWADELKLALDGYRNEISKIEGLPQVNLMILDAATPGRTSICYYREMGATDFIDRIEKWHIAGTWRQHFFDKETNRGGTFFGVPHPERIIYACYGEKVSDNQKKMVLERLFQCIINGQPIPRDIVSAGVARVIHQSCIATGDKYRKWYRELLEPVCSLVRNRIWHKESVQKKEGYAVALDKENRDRSYLYGRFLSIADKMERATFNQEERSKRLTNAMKYMERFSQRPCSTWQILQMRLLPYEQKVEKYSYYRKLLDEVGSLFDEPDFVSDQPLDGKFLLGFYCQNYDIEQRIAAAAARKKEKQAKDNAHENEGRDNDDRAAEEN